MAKNDPYTKLVDIAAVELERAVRSPACAASGNMPTVYAIPTTDEQDGQVVIVMPGQPAPDRGVAIMPNANYASTHTSWYSVEFTAIRHILWQALRNQQILPREKPPSGPHIVSLVEAPRHRAMLEKHMVYEVHVNGKWNGDKISYNMRGYIGYLPTHDGGKIDIGEKSISAFRKEVVAINRAAKAAGRI